MKDNKTKIKESDLKILMNKPSYWTEALTYLSAKDEILAQLIRGYPDEVLISLNNPFQTLIRAIVGQQISVKAADAVWQRLVKKLENISTQEFLALGEEELKECGLSRPKIAYITNIAKALENKILRPEQWSEMTDKEVIRQLIQIKGVGQWTAEMFLIFHLHRPDVFPVKDLGLINGIRLNYGNLSEAEIIYLSEKWKPYRTVATWYLWLSLDPVTVQY
jgi:DNA-3-methyladenine glycosylase II